MHTLPSLAPSAFLFPVQVIQISLVDRLKLALTLHYSGSGTEESIHQIRYSSKNCSGPVSGTYSFNAIDSCYSISEPSGPLASIYGYSFESCYYVPETPTVTPTVSGTRPTAAPTNIPVYAIVYSYYDSSSCSTIPSVGTAIILNTCFAGAASSNYTIATLSLSTGLLTATIYSTSSCTGVPIYTTTTSIGCFGGVFNGGTLLFSSQIVGVTSLATWPASGPVTR